MAIKSSTNPPPIFIDPSSHTTPNGEAGWAFQTTGDGRTYFKYENYGSCVDAYLRCPPVSAIINRKSQAYTNGKTWLLDDEGKVAAGKDAQKFYDLWAKPNPIQSTKQFEAQTYAYLQLFGFCIVLPVMPVGFTDPLDASSLWNIPANWIDWNSTMERFNAAGGQSVTEIVLYFNGRKSILQVKDLLIIRDLGVSFNSLTFPSSKILNMAMPINNIIGAFESRGVLINQRGAQGILSSDPGRGQFAALPLQPHEKEDLQRDFKKYGLRNKQWQVIMTTAALRWQAMGYATKDLMLFEEVAESAKSVCDGMNFPPHLLGLIDPTFNNQLTAEKGMYRNGVVPDSDNIYDHWQRYFKFTERKLNLSKDFSLIECLQEDKLALAQARKSLNDALLIEYNANLITANRWRELNGEDTVLGQDKYKFELDKIYSAGALPPAVVV